MPKTTNAEGRRKSNNDLQRKWFKRTQLREVEKESWPCEVELGERVSRTALRKWPRIQIACITLPQSHFGKVVLPHADMGRTFLQALAQGTLQISDGLTRAHPTARGIAGASKRLALLQNLLAFQGPANWLLSGTGIIKALVRQGTD
jgi:hypothetical protein